MLKKERCLDDAKQYDIYLLLSWDRYGIERATDSSAVLVDQRLDYSTARSKKQCDVQNEDKEFWV